MMEVKFLKIHPDAKIPEYAHLGDSGMDLWSVNPAYLFTGVPVAVSTGLKIEISKGYEGQIRPKSGLAMAGVTVANTPGTIDAGYRGELKVILLNFEDSVYEIQAGQKIAQLVICPVVYAEIRIVDELSHTPREEGGFGSTGL